MSISGTALPSLVVPGADFPAWAPWAFAAIGLTTIAVLVYQAVRYFRDNQGDDDNGGTDGGDGGTDRRDSGDYGGSADGEPGTPGEPGDGTRDRRDGGG